MGKLFPAEAGQVVTVFAFAPALKTDLQWFWHPDTKLRPESSGLRWAKRASGRNQNPTP